MTDALRAQSAEEIGGYIKEALRDYIQGGPDKTAECLALGEGLDWVPGYVARAREARAQWEAEKETEVWIKDAREASSFLPASQPGVEGLEPATKEVPVEPELVKPAAVKARLVRTRDGIWYWVKGTDRRRWWGPRPQIE